MQNRRVGAEKQLTQHPTISEKWSQGLNSALPEYQYCNNFSKWFITWELLHVWHVCTAPTSLYSFLFCAFPQHLSFHFVPLTAPLSSSSMWFICSLVCLNRFTFLSWTSILLSRKSILVGYCPKDRSDLQGSETIWI